MRLRVPDDCNCDRQLILLAMKSVAKSQQQIHSGYAITPDVLARSLPVKQQFHNSLVKEAIAGQATFGGARQVYGPVADGRKTPTGEGD